MLRLVNSNLPTSTVRGSGGGVVCKVYWGEYRELAPIARINVLAPYQGNPIFNGGTVDLPTPKYTGEYYRFDLGYEVLEVQIPKFSQITEPTSAIPSNVWVEGSVINLYTDKTHAINTPFRFSAIARLIVLPKINKAFTFPVSDGFQVRSGESECLFLGSDIVNQTNNTVNVNTHLLRVGADIDFTGEQTLSVREPVAKIAIFDLSHTRLTLPYSIEYMGSVFVPTQNPRSPQVGEFLWNEQTRYVTIFQRS